MREAFRDSHQTPLRNTVVVRVAGQRYEVTTFRGSLKENSDAAAKLDAGGHIGPGAARVLLTSPGLVVLAGRSTCLLHEAWVHHQHAARSAQECMVPACAPVPPPDCNSAKLPHAPPGAHNQQPATTHHTPHLQPLPRTPHQQPQHLPHTCPPPPAESRDFTINALFYDTATNKVLDYVGGVPDLAQRLIRLCNNEPARLREDPIRVLRAARFAAQFGCSLDVPTAHALQQYAERCSREGGGWLRPWRHALTA